MPDEIPQEIIDVVVARLEESADGRFTAFGNEWGELSKQTLISEVTNRTELGRKIIDVELTYIKALVSGELLREVSS